MASIKFTNFARSTIAVGIDSNITTIALASGTGLLFPAIVSGQYFYLTLENASLFREVVKVTARTIDSLTVVRAQDNTAARAWSAGDSISLRLNALAIEESLAMASGGVGGGTNRIVFENDITVTDNYTITAGRNGITAGPITINSGVTVTVPTGSVWTIV